MCFYVFPLLFETYWYDNNPNSQLIEELPFFHQIRDFENQMFMKFSYINDPDYSSPHTISHFKRGLIITIFLHFLMFWLVCSMIRTMKTNPGTPPNSDSDWAMKIENQVSLFHEKEKELVKKYVKLEKTFAQNNARIKTEISSEAKDFPLVRTLSLPSSKQKSELDNPLIGVIREKNEDDDYEQGRQGVHSEKSWFFNSGSEEESPQINDKDQEKINETALGRIMKWGIFRYCRHCKGFKPLRTHHCQQCMKCVLKMDHHCQWVMNCIGLRNYKYFMNMLIYGNLSLIFLMITFSRCVTDVALNPYIDGITIYLVLVNYVLIIVMSGMVFGFTSFHFWLIFTGKTTLEHCEKDKKKSNENLDEQLDKMKKINYDEGSYKNFVAIFNKNPFLWFFPVNRNENENGLFEKFEDNHMNKIEEQKLEKK